MATQENWKPIPGYEGLYEVSDKSRVKSLARVINHGQHGITRQIAEKFLRTSINNGYLVAYLSPPQRSRKAKIFYVEKAVLQLFPETTDEIDSLPEEEWKDIGGYEGLYKISNLGRVLSLPRVIDDGQGRNRFIRGRIRMPVIAGNCDYPQVEFAKNGKVKTILVHRLVAKAFVPNPLGLEIVHHKDENQSNCRADNLEWVTRAGNVQDWFDRRRVVVSTDTIAKILEAHAAGHTPAEILAALPRKRKAGKS